MGCDIFDIAKIPRANKDANVGNRLMAHCLLLNERLSYLAAIILYIRYK